MIRLRDMFERGRAHPVLGPILLIALVVLLALVFLHVAHQGFDALVELGAICAVFAIVLGLPAAVRRTWRSDELVPETGDRGPPRALAPYLRGHVVATAPASSIPLRR